MANLSKLIIPEGGMYQEWMCLSDVVTKMCAKKLERLSVQKGWEILTTDEAINYGYEELANWSFSDTDLLVLIGDKYLVCIPKKDFIVD